MLDVLYPVVDALKSGATGKSLIAIADARSRGDDPREGASADALPSLAIGPSATWIPARARPH